MADPASPEEVRTGLVTDALRRHAWLVAICALLGLALGYGAGLTSSTTYTSKATVLVNPLLGNPYSPDGSGDSLTNLETEAQLVRSDVLANEVSSSTGLDPQTLQKNLTVSVPINTQIVEIAFTSADAQQAQEVVNDYADGYLAARQSRRDAVVLDQATNLDQQINDTQDKLQTATAKAQKGDAFQARLAQTLTGQLSSLRIQAAQVSGSGRNPGEPISPGVVASTPNGISPTLTLLGGLVIGLLLGALLAVSRERSSHVLRHLEQVEHAGLPVLGVFTGRRDENRAAVYRHVRAGLGTGPPSTLAVAATTSDVAAGIVAAELALSYTHIPEDVVLVDAVGTSSRLLSLEDGRSEVGLSEVLLGRASLDQALVRVSPDAAASVHLLQPGTEVEGGAERYASAAMGSLLATLNSGCGRVLLASPSLSEPDGSSLAAQADAAIVVIVLDQTSYADVMSAREWLGRSGTALMGAVVITRVGRKSPFAAGAVRPVAPPQPVEASAPLPQDAVAAGSGATAMDDFDVASFDRLPVDEELDRKQGVNAQTDARRRETHSDAGHETHSDAGHETHSDAGHETDADAVSKSKTSGRSVPSVPHG